MQVFTLSRGELHTTHAPQPGDAILVIYEDVTPLEPAWMKLYRWRHAVGFRDLDDHELSWRDRALLRMGRVPGLGDGMPRNAMVPAHARSIAAFLRQLQPSHGATFYPQRLYVACEYGRSRSVAVARAAANHFWWTYAASMPGNRRVLRLATAALQST